MCVYVNSESALCDFVLVPAGFRSSVCFFIGLWNNWKGSRIQFPFQMLSLDRSHLFLEFQQRKSTIISIKKEESISKHNV